MAATVYDHLHIITKKGKKKIIQYFAAEQGKSLNAFVNEAIDEKMLREAHDYYADVTRQNGLSVFKG